MTRFGQPSVVVTCLLFASSAATLLRDPHQYTYTMVRGGKSWSTTDGFKWGDTRKRGIESLKKGLCDKALPVEDGIEESKKIPLILERVRDTDGMKIRTKDGDVNIIGVRKNSPLGICPKGKTDDSCWKDVFTNKFDDELHLVWHCSELDVYRHYTTAMTTLPGHALMSSSKTSVMKPGQYLNKYCMGDHNGYPALKCMGVDQWLLERHSTGPTSSVYRLQESASGNPTATKSWALNFHSTILKKGYGYTPTKVKNWSKGCQVVPGKKEWRDIILPIIKTALEDETLTTDHDGRCYGGTRADCSKCLSYTLLDDSEGPSRVSPGNPTKEEEEEGDKSCVESKNDLINTAIETICNIDKSKGKAKCNDGDFVDWVYCLTSITRGEAEAVRFGTEGPRSKPCKIEQGQKYTFSEEVRHYKAVAKDPAVVCTKKNGYSAPGSNDKHDCSQHKTKDDCTTSQSDKTWCTWSKHESSAVSTALQMFSLKNSESGNCVCGNGFHCCTSVGRVNTCKKASGL